jgi:hypothetical protein
MLTAYRDIVALRRRFGETVVTETIKFGDTKRRRCVAICALNSVGATLSPRHAQGEVHCGEQSFDDFVKGRAGGY